MPPVAAAVAVGAVSAGAAVVAGATIGTAVALGVGIAGLTLVTGGMTPSSPSIDGNISTTSALGARLSNITNPDAAIAVLYGECKVGVNRVYAHTTGKNNQWLHLIACFGEGETYSLEKLFLEDDDILIYLGSKTTVTGTPTTRTDVLEAAQISDLPTPTSPKEQKIRDNVRYYFHNGSSTQNYDISLHNIDSNFTDAMRHTCYVYLRIKYDNDLYQSLPKITALIKGIKVYDLRDNTTKYSNNPALILYDFITNERYGVGIDSSYLDSTSWESAANWCDENGYEFNGIIYRKEKALDIITKILTNFRGALIWSGGKFKLKILDYDSVVMSLDEDDIVEEGPSANIVSIQDLLNTTKVKYVDKDDYYTFQEIVVEDPSAIDSDGEVRSKTIELIGTIDKTQAIKLGNYNIDRSRLLDTYTFTCRPKAMALEPVDMISVTSSDLGWKNQICRVMSVHINADYTVTLTVVKEQASIYDNIANTATSIEYSTTLPDPERKPASVDNIRWTENTYRQGDNTYSRVKVQFDKPDDPFWDYAEIYQSWSDDTELPIADGLYTGDGSVYGGSIGAWRFLGKNDRTFTIDNLREGQTIVIRIISVSKFGVKQSLGDVQSHTITIEGLSDYPLAVQNFQAISTRDGVNLRWDAVSDIEQDIAYYEIRKGISWGNSVLLGRTRSTSWSLGSLQPGTYTFLIKAKNTGRVYSKTAANITCTIYTPIGYTELITSPYNEDYDSGIHNGTSYEDDPVLGRLLLVPFPIDGTFILNEDGEYLLTENGDSLLLDSPATSINGDYTGITFDLGAVKTVKVGLQDYSIHYYGEGTTWDTTMVTTQVWNDLFTTDNNWLNLFGTANTGTYHIRLYYSETGVDFSYLDFAETFSPEVSMRYFYIRVYIENYSEESYIKIEDINIRVYES